MPVCVRTFADSMWAGGKTPHPTNVGKQATYEQKSVNSKLGQNIAYV